MRMGAIGYDEISEIFERASKQDDFTVDIVDNTIYTASENGGMVGENSWLIQGTDENLEKFR